MAKSVGNIALLARRARRSGAATRCSCSSSAATTASRCAFADETLARRGRASRRLREAGAAAARRRRRREDMAALRERFFDALADDFNTPAGAGRACATGSARPTARERRRRRDDLREMLARARPRQPARRRDGADGGPTRALELLDAPRAGPRRADFADGRPAARRARARSGWEVRDGAGRRPRAACRPRPVIVYGRNAGRTRRCGAAAGGPSAGVVGRPQSGAAREPWLRGAACRSRSSTRTSRRGAAGSDGHQGVCAEAEPVPLRGRRPSCCAAPDPLARRARRGPGPAEPRRDLPHGRGRGRDRRRDPRAPRGARSRRRSCKASAGAVEHLRDRPRAQPRRLPARRRQARRAAGPTARPPARAPSRTPSPTTRAGSCSCSAPRASGLRPRVAARLRRAVALPLRGRIGSLNVSAAAAALLYGILHQRDSA